MQGFLHTAGAQKQLELAAAAAEATAANEPGPRAVQCNPVQTTKSYIEQVEKKLSSLVLLSK